MKKIALLICLSFVTDLKSQNLYPVVIEHCRGEKFCADCGDQQVSVDQGMFDQLLSDLNKSPLIKEHTGYINFQVLVDAYGNGCVRSHTDTTENKLTSHIIKKLNRFQGWRPAITGYEIEPLSSVSMKFEVSNGVLMGEIDRRGFQIAEPPVKKPQSVQLPEKTVLEIGVPTDENIVLIDSIIKVGKLDVYVVEYCDEQLFLKAQQMQWTAEEVARRKLQIDYDQFLQRSVYNAYSQLTADELRAILQFMSKLNADRQARVYVVAGSVIESNIKTFIEKYLQ